MKRSLIILLLVSISLFAQTKEDSAKANYIDARIAELQTRYAGLEKEKAEIKKDSGAKLNEIAVEQEELNKQFRKFIDDKKKLLAKKPAGKK